MAVNFVCGRTLDLGFEKDLTVILNALNAAGSSRQTVLLSATLTEGKPASGFSTSSRYVPVDTSGTWKWVWHCMKCWVVPHYTQTN